jgi:hypothetical protein
MDQDGSRRLSLLIFTQMVPGWCPDGVDGFSFLAKGGTFAVNPDGFRKVPDGSRMVSGWQIFFFFFLSYRCYINKKKILNNIF